MPEKTRCGVIGVGHLGFHHARLYHEMPDVELVGIADINKKNAQKAAAKFKTEFYTDPFALIGRVNAVSVATPTENHYEIAKEFIKNNINVLVEKPITNDPEKAEDLIKTAEDKSLVLQVGHVERYNAAVRKAAEYIKDPRFIEVNRLSRFPKRSLDIGVVLDLMIHDIDIILSFVKSPVKNIYSVGASVFSPKEDIANCRIEFDNGCVANITASRVSYKTERKFRVFEEDSYISLDYEQQAFVVYKKKKKQIKSPLDVERITPKVEKTEPLKEELSDFVRCVREKRQPIVSGHHGLTALKLALEITGKIR